MQFRRSLAALLVLLGAGCAQEELHVEPPLEPYRPQRVVFDAVDASRFAVLERGGRVTVWSAAGDDRPLRLATLPERATDVAPAADSIAIVNGTGVLRIFGLDGKRRHAPEHQAALVVATRTHFVTGGEDGFVRVYRLDGTYQHGWNAGAPVHDLAATPDGARIATLRRDGAVEVWKRTDGRVISFDRLASFDRITGVPKSIAIAGGRYVIVAAGGGRPGIPYARGVTIFTIGAEANRVVLPPALDIWSSTIDDVAGSPVAGYFAVATPAGIDLWNVDGTRRDGGSTFGDSRQGTVNVSFSSTGALLASCGGRQDPSIRLWDMNAMAVAEVTLPRESADFAVLARSRIVTADDALTLRRMDGSLLAETPLPARALALSCRNDLCAVLLEGSDRIVALWQADDAGFTALRSFAAPRATVLAVTHGGDVVTSADENGPSTITLWRDGQPLRSVALSLRVEQLAVAPGDRIAVAGRQSVILLDGGLQRLAAVNLPGRDRIEAVSFSPAGREIVVAQGRDVQRWTPPAGTAVRQPADDARDVDHAPHDDLFATAGAGSVHLWRDGAVFGAPIRLPDGTASQVAFAPDAGVFVAGDGRKLTVYELSGSPRLTLARTSEELRVAISPTDRIAVASPKTGRVEVWDGAGELLASRKGTTAVFTRDDALVTFFGSRPRWMDATDEIVADDRQIELLWASETRAAGKSAARLRLWDSRGAALEELLLGDNASDVATDGVTSAVAADGTRRGFLTIQRQGREELREETSPLLSVDVAGDVVAVGGRKGLVQLYRRDASSGKWLGVEETRLGGEHAVTAIRLRDDAEEVLVSVEGEVRRYRVTGDGLKCTATAATDVLVREVGFTRAGFWAFAGGDEVIFFKDDGSLAGRAFASSGSILIATHAGAIAGRGRLFDDAHVYRTADGTPASLEQRQTLHRPAETRRALAGDDALLRAWRGVGRGWRRVWDTVVEWGWIKASGVLMSTLLVLGMLVPLLLSWVAPRAVAAFSMRLPDKLPEWKWLKSTVLFVSFAGLSHRALNAWLAANKREIQHGFNENWAVAQGPATHAHAEDVESFVQCVLESKRACYWISDGRSGAADSLAAYIAHEAARRSAIVPVVITGAEEPLREIAGKLRIGKQGGSYQPQIEAVARMVRDGQILVVASGVHQWQEKARGAARDLVKLNEVRYLLVTAAEDPVDADDYRVLHLEAPLAGSLP